MVLHLPGRLQLIQFLTKLRSRLRAIDKRGCHLLQLGRVNPACYSLERILPPIQWVEAHREESGLADAFASLFDCVTLCLLLGGKTITKSIRPNAGSAEWSLNVPAGGEKTLRYTVVHEN